MAVMWTKDMWYISCKYILGLLVNQIELWKLKYCDPTFIKAKQWWTSKVYVCLEYIFCCFWYGLVGGGWYVNSFKMVFKDEIMFVNSLFLKKIVFPFNMIPNHLCWIWINPTNERCLCIKCTFPLLWVNYDPENEFTNVLARWVCLGLLRAGCWQWKEFGHHVTYTEC